MVTVNEFGCISLKNKVADLCHQNLKYQVCEECILVVQLGTFCEKAIQYIQVYN